MENLPIRVLFVVGSLHVGGAEMHLAQILPRLNTRGIDASILTMSGGGVLADRLMSQRVDVRIAQADGADGAQPTLVSRTRRIVRGARALWRTLREERPDVVHFFLPGAYIVGAPVAILAGGAKRAMSRRSLNDHHNARPFAGWLERRLHWWMHALLGNSGAVVAQLIEEGAPPGRVRLIRSGVDLSRFEGAHAEPDAPGRLELLCVANLIPYKGHGDLIDALAAAGDSIGDWRLRLVGRDDGIGAALRARAAAAGLATRIEFLGPREDVPALMASAHVALLCSHQEGFPNAVIEAMAAGLPVVATAVGGVPEAVSHGETGLLVPARAPSAIAAAIRELANDPTKRASMGAAGATRARVMFSAERCADEYVSFYRALLGSCA